MKYLFSFLVLMLSLNFAIAKDPITKATFEVNGNCGMCKKTIEKAAKVEGVSNAKWNVKTHILEVSYNEKKISLDQIQLRVAAAGYDTPAYKANEETYRSLHTCCQYSRSK